MKWMTLRWVAMEALRICVNQGWPEEDRFWGRPVLVVSDDWSHYRCSMIWCLDESPLLLALTSSELANLAAMGDSDRYEMVRALTLHAIACENSYN